MDEFLPEKGTDRHALTPLESLDVLSARKSTGIVLINNGGISIEKFGASKMCEDSTIEMKDGLVITGQPVVEVLVGAPGQSGQFATLEVIDFSGNNMISSDGENCRIVGYAPDRDARGIGAFIDIRIKSNFGVVMRDKDGNPMEFFDLVPGQPVEVGRDLEKKGARWLPETVSKDHLSIYIDENTGNLVVENHEPTNETLVRRPDSVRYEEYDPSYLKQEISPPVDPPKSPPPPLYREAHARRN